MGSTLLTHRVDSTNFGVAWSVFYELYTQANQEYGDDPFDAYSGDWNTFTGFFVSFHTATDDESAKRYISDHAKKWGYAIAVWVENEKGEADHIMFGGRAAE